MFLVPTWSREDFKDTQSSNPELDIDIIWLSKQGPNAGLEKVTDTFQADASHSQRISLSAYSTLSINSPLKKVISYSPLRISTLWTSNLVELVYADYYDTNDDLDKETDDDSKACETFV
ncbi:hypothetical protein MPER_12641 [Moniliophthora perniciosa FA553]|nr:hypothetical protein MPER_12641 [Moniliophthora perniciosa FA553]